jgi:ribonuclease D
LLSEQYIALDTESNSRHAYPERVCLIQIATCSKIYIIDTIAVEDISALGNVLSDDTIVKVIQGAEYDLRCLNRDWAFTINNLFDTALAAQFIGLKQIGLSALIETLLGKNIPKNARIQKSDWSRRPLTAESLEYAAQDVEFLIDVAKHLIDRLAILYRSSWVFEEMERLERIRYVAPDSDTSFLALKGSKTLTGEEKAVLKRLFAVRESEAIRRNQPPYYVLSHEKLIDIALNPIDGLDKTFLTINSKEVYFHKLLQQAVLMGQQDAPIGNLGKSYRKLPNHFEAERLRSLKRWRTVIGDGLSIDPYLVWPRVSLERLAKCPVNLESELESFEIREWQKDQFSGLLEDFLADEIIGLTK